MALARISNPVDGTTALTAALWDTEFDNIYNNALSLISPLTGNLDCNGKTLQNFALQAFAKAGLPAAGTAGRLARVTDNVRGVWMDQGSQWFGLNGEVVHAREFGFRPSATAAENDAAFVQATAALPSTGGEIVLGPGTHNISSDLLIRLSNVRLRGQGIGVTIVKIGTIWTTAPAANTVPAMVNLVPNPSDGSVRLSNIEIHGITFIGALAPATANEPKAISGAFADNVTISGCELKDFGHEGIWQAGGGISFSTKWRILHNHCTNIGINSSPTAPSAVTLNVNDAVVAGNTFETVLQAVGAAGNRASIIGNQIRDAKLGGIGVGGDGIGNDAAIVGNVIQVTANATYTAEGIRINGDAINVLANGNVIRVTSVSGALRASGIRLAGARNGVEISSNSIVLDGGTTGGLVNGIQYDADAANLVDVDINSNLVRLINNNAQINQGIAGDALAGQTQKVRARGNTCLGFVRSPTVTTYAFDLRASVGTLTLIARDNVADGGYQRYQNTLLQASDADTRYDNVPVSSWNRGPVAVVELEGSATLNFGAPAAVPGSVDLTITVTGARLGDEVAVSAPVTVGANYLLTAFVSANDTVTVRWTQIAGAAADPDGAGGTYRVRVWQH